MPQKEIKILVDEVGPMDPALRNSKIVADDDLQAQANGCYWNSGWYVQGNFVCTWDNKKMICGAGGQWYQSGECYPHPTEV
jgi:hypothetical protein